MAREEMERRALTRRICTRSYVTTNKQTRANRHYELSPVTHKQTSESCDICIKCLVEMFYERLGNVFGTHVLAVLVAVVADDVNGRLTVLESASRFQAPFLNLELTGAV